MQSMHGNNMICSMHKGVVNVINATIVQNDVIMGWFIKSMNMVIGAQCDVIMQLMVGNNIMMYEYAIKVFHNKFAKEMHKLIYHG